MKKLFRSTLAVAGAFAMAVTSVAAVPTVAKAADEGNVFEPEKMPAGEVHYTVAGGFGKTNWNPLSKDTELKAVEGLEGVYSYTAYVPAYDENNEWRNRFKVCKIDNSVIDGTGWGGSLCVGTTTYADNQSQIRIKNTVSGNFTVYFDTVTGAVVVTDEDGARQELSISWVGFDNETQFMTEEEISKSTLDKWPADKVKVDAVPDVQKINNALFSKINDMVPENMKAGEMHYTVAGGFGATNWNPLSKATEMKAVEGLDGVYSYTAKLPAYSDDTEWMNRFKVCRIDNSIIDGTGWGGSLCVGTSVYNDNQTQIRVKNANEGTFTVYHDSKTGAVVVTDENGARQELSISWVGFDNETQFMTEEEVSKSTLDKWPADKVKVDAVPDVQKINNDLYTKLISLEPEKMAVGEAHYTVAGGFGITNWNPLSKATEMKEVGDGIYTFKAELPAYAEATEWQNRFKICKIDNTIIDGTGWGGSLCVGTTTYADNQSQIRVLNEVAGTYTIFFDSKTGAVVVKGQDGKQQPLSISWVGFDNETQFMTEEEIAATTLDKWPADKVKVDAVPNVKEINDKLALEVFEFVPENMAADEVHYTVAGGFGDANWKPLSKLTEMKETDIKGVYSFKAYLPAYAEATEWQNRFKVCRINNTIIDGTGWGGSLCVGTTTYADNQSQIRVLNKVAGNVTIYFDSTTGAVVVLDANGKKVDLSISWVGFDNETQFMSEFEVEGSKLEIWPADKVKVDAVAKVDTVNAELYQKLKAVETSEPEKPVVKPSLALKVSTRTLYTGKASYSTTIKASVTGESKKVTWKSSNTKVATVSNGKVTAKKAGKAKITATANGITKTVTITVKNPTITVKLGSKKITSISVKAKSTTKLAVSTSPSKAGYKATYANSASKKLIKISTSGSKVTVKALKKGTAKVKITSGGSTRTITIKVK